MSSMANHYKCIALIKRKNVCRTALNQTVRSFVSRKFPLATFRDQIQIQHDFIFILSSLAYLRLNPHWAALDVHRLKRGKAMNGPCFTCRSCWLLRKNVHWNKRFYTWMPGVRCKLTARRTSHSGTEYLKYPEN